ncbi:MAG: NADH-quinone oxidoreductase subunit L [Nitrospiraceae bacterium]|nr:NADH-quinone oxidoreductase subunit L [Nitrospiraceae bacterium]
MVALSYLTIVLLFVGSILAFLIGKYTRKWNSFWVAVITSFIALCSVIYIAVYVGLHGAISNQFTWFKVGTLSIPLGIYIDPLSVTIALVATGIGFLDIVYSKGYMENDKSPERYYLENLFFIGSMVGLVFSSNLIGLYAFWEAVGLASYLLIGYWYWKKTAAEAALKAFTMTRFGDVFMLAGILISYVYLGTVNFQELNALSTAGAFSVKLGYLISVLLFIGAIGKSAQFPLFPWLLDAMEGPTTVSALIHAATMVNAGIYLVARMFPFFSYSKALIVVAAIGAITAFIGATSALVRREMKKILAFSTMEHLALMFVGLGVGSAAAGIYHLVNHAVFKALLFLSAGSVIHMTHEKDGFKLRGLYRYMPQTAIVFLIGILALSGIPPFNGYFSKDWILAESYRYGNPIIFILTFSACVLCIAYGFRLWFVVFTGKPSEESKHAKEAPYVMLIPLYILATFTLITAFYKDQIVEFLFGKVTEPYYPGLLVVTSITMFILFVIVYLIYYKGKWSTEKLLSNPLGHALNTFLFKGWLVNDTILWICRNIFYGSISKSIRWFDRVIVDGAVNGIVSVSLWTWNGYRRIQSGNLSSYLTIMVIGALSLAIILFIV